MSGTATMHSFTSGLPMIATKNDTLAHWGGGKPGEYFRCGFCGYKFREGDYWRWVYTNDTPGAGGNPFVCQTCDGPRVDLLARWKAKYDTVRQHREGLYWWFYRGDGE